MTAVLARNISEALVARWPGLAKQCEPALFLSTIKDAIDSFHVTMGIATDEARQIPPRVEVVAAFLKKIGSDLEAQDFMDFYAAKDWIVGRTKMKNWHAAAQRAHRLWERPGKRNAGGTTTAATVEAPLTEWERSKKEERLKAMQIELRDFTHPGGSAWPRQLAPGSEEYNRAQTLVDRIAALRRELDRV